MKRCILVLTLCLASACSGGLRSSNALSQVYVLRATTAGASAKPAQPLLGSLQVALPLAGPGLDSERIVTASPDHRMDYYAGSRWAAELPQLVEALAVERLQASGAWQAVNDSRSTFASQYYLQITIRRFEAEYGAAAAPTARVSFDCAIGQRAQRELITRFTVEAQAVASANRVGAVVQAFEVAANAALATLAERSQAAVKNPPLPSTP